MNSKTVIKNTFILYFRMIFVMGVTLFTTRIVLNQLGIQDYGIYNVVAGIISLFAFMSNSMMAATQRFFSFHIGQNNYSKLSNTFSTSLWIYIILSIIILIIGETLGLNLVKNHLKIPDDRYDAAIFVYHFSILSFVISILTIPYTALIVAHERMNVFALVGVFEVVLRLLVAYIISMAYYDKLKVYGALMFIVVFFVFLLYVIYCFIKYKEAKLRLSYDVEIFKEMFGFTGWNLFGALAGVINNQGANILLNVYFGAPVNGARAISLQISTAINQLVTNFMTATKPTIIKSYAKGENDLMFRVVNSTSKLSFFLLTFVAVPILIETSFIIELWLGKVPDFVVLFTRLIIITALVDSLSYSLMTMVQATGKIKFYQICMGSLLLVNIPISFVFFELGYESSYIMLVNLAISVFALFTRLVIINNMLTEFNIAQFIFDVIGRSVLVFLLVFVFLFYTKQFFSEGIIRLCFVTVVSTVSILVFIYILGLVKDEREIIKNHLHKFISR